MKHSNSSNSSKNRMSGEAMYYEYPRVNFYPESDLKKLLMQYNAMIPHEPRPLRVVEPPPSAGIPPAILARESDCRATFAMVASTKQQTDSPNTIWRRMHHLQLAEVSREKQVPWPKLKCQVHKRYMLPSEQERVRRMVQVDGEVLPDGDDLGDG